MKNKDTAKEIFESLTGFGVNMPHTALFLIEGILNKKDNIKYDGNLFITQGKAIERSHNVRFKDDLIDD